MDKGKFKEKIKEGVSVREIEEFARQHTIEVFAILAIIIATITSIWDYFTGSRMAIFFLAIGTIIAILFPVPIERGLKRFYNFVIKQEKATQIIVGIVKIVAAIFVPFILFAVIGLLAGSSFHYFIRHAQVVQENKPTGEKH